MTLCSPDQKAAKLKAGSIDASPDQIATKLKARNVETVPDQTAAKFVASSLVDSGDSLPALKESANTDRVDPNLPPTSKFLKLDCFRVLLAAPITINGGMTNDD